MRVKGSSVGVRHPMINSSSAAWIVASGGSRGHDAAVVGGIRMTFEPLLYGVGLAILLTLLLNEPGRSLRVPVKFESAATV